MTKRLGVYLVGILAGTSIGCGVDTSYRLTPVGDVAWNGVVARDVQLWGDALGPDCPFPLIVGPNGMPVTYYPQGVWPDNPNAIGAYVYSTFGGGVRIDIRGNDRSATLAHEMGHAIGLGHSEDPTSLMYAYYNAVQGPTAGDVVEARATLGCEQ